MTPLIIKSNVAEAAVSPYRVLKFGATDFAVLHATAVTDKLAGVADALGQATVGSRVDVVKDGMTYAEFGGTVARGDDLTVDGSGRVVTAAPGAGTNNCIIGKAEQSGVLGDIALISIWISTKQG